MKNDKFNKRILFLIGCFSLTQIQIIGFIGISELVLFFFAPIFLFQDWERLKRHGFQSIIVLSLLNLAGTIVANVYNHIPFVDAARGIAASYAVFAIIVCLHHFLAPNITHIIWLIFGCAVSAIISIFAFQYGASRGFQGEILEGQAAVQNVMGYSLFWASLLSTWLSLPLKIMYLRVPFVYVIVVGLFLPTFALLQAGGRSAFLMTAFGFILILTGGKKRASMQRVRRYFVVLMLGYVILAGALAGIYRYAVTHGKMKEGQIEKYEAQTRMGTGVMGLLIGGRVSAFAGFFAALQNPLIGYGAWARDTRGFYGQFLAGYGNEDDYQAEARRAASGNLDYIPAHSQIIQAWIWNGFFGLIFWLYVLYLYVSTFKKYMAVIPQWYGYLALTLPAALWDLLFSPFGNRISACMLFVVCLFVRAVAERRMPLPPELILGAAPARKRQLYSRNYF